MRKFLNALTALAVANVLGNATAGAQTSTGLTSSQIRATYAAIKEMAKGEVRKKEKGTLFKRTERFQRTVSEAWTNLEKTDKYYVLWADFGSCDWNDDFLSSMYTNYKDSFAIHLISGLAIDVSFWSEQLPTIGYPVDIWKPLVDSFEKSQLDKLSQMDFAKLRPKNIKPDPLGDPLFHSEFEKGYNRDAEALASALNAYREREHKSIPKIEVYDEKCTGAGGLTVRITTDPNDGDVRLIPVFFYKLCKVQKIDPNDGYRCDRWREVVKGAEFEVSGDYRYRARWNDGGEREGVLPFATKQMDDAFRIEISQRYGVRWRKSR